MTAEAVTAHLLARSALRYSRASGPGGQHRDHTESRAELLVSLAAVEGLPEEIARRLTDRLRLGRKPLRLASQADRSRERNRATVERALGHRVAAALTAEKPRTATKPSRAAVARRLDQKAHRSRLKAGRQRVTPD